MPQQVRRKRESQRHCSTYSPTNAMIRSFSHLPGWSSAMSSPCTCDAWYVRTSGSSSCTFASILGEARAPSSTETESLTELCGYISGVSHNVDDRQNTTTCPAP